MHVGRTNYSLKLALLEVLSYDIYVPLCLVESTLLEKGIVIRSQGSLRTTVSRLYRDGQIARRAVTGDRTRTEIRRAHPS